MDYEKIKKVAGVFMLSKKFEEAFESYLHNVTGMKVLLNTRSEIPQRAEECLWVGCVIASLGDSENTASATFLGISDDPRILEKMSYSMRVSIKAEIERVDGEVNPLLGKIEGYVLSAFMHSFTLQCLIENQPSLDAVNIQDVSLQSADMFIDDKNAWYRYEAEFVIEFSINASAIRGLFY